MAILLLDSTLRKRLDFDAKNTLAVKVDNTVVDDVYPQMADFTFYGGIYRDVNLVIANPVHFDLMDHGSKGIYVIQEEVNEEQAALTIKSLLVNDSEEDKKVRLWVDLLDAEGKNIAYAAKEVTLVAGRTQSSRSSACHRESHIMEWQKKCLYV